MSAQPRVTTPVDNRALLAAIGHRRVRNVAAESGQYAEALFAVVLERKARGESWDESEWNAVLVELDASALTIAEFLQAEHDRKAVRQ